MTNIAESYQFPSHVLMDVLSGILDAFYKFPPGHYDQEETLRNILSIKEYLEGSNSQIEGSFSASTNEFLALIGSAINLTEIEASRFGTGEKNKPVALLHSLIKLRGSFGKALRTRQSDRIRGLYVIIDPQVTNGRDPLDIARGAVRGGARIIQLRDKLRDKGEIMPLATELKNLCQDNNVLLIINDHVDMAAALGTDNVGVHVGQTDLSVADSRSILHESQLIGRSNREIPLLIESQEMGADHVAFGAIYPTTTKPGGIGYRGNQGPDRVKEARSVTNVPLVCIGGINADNVAPVVEAGADAICVAAAIGLADDPEAEAKKLVEAIRSAGGPV